MKCDHCDRPASQEYPIDDKWYPVCDVHAHEFGGLRPLTLPTTSQTILSQAQEIIAGRHERYGDCTEVFAATNEMFAIYRGLKKGETSAHDTAVFNIIQKLVRIGSGQNHQDNWIDIAGYAATGGEVSE